MPQLDFFTFIIQYFFIVWSLWSLVMVFISLILPQYLIFDNSKKILWQAIKKLLFFMKSMAFHNFIELLSIYNKLHGQLARYLKGCKFLIQKKIYFRRKNLRKFFFGFFSIILKFLNLSLNSYNYEQKNKFNFLFINKLSYSFGAKYKILKINLKSLYERYVVFEVLEARLLIDEAFKSSYIYDLDKMSKMYFKKYPYPYSNRDHE